MSSIAQRLRVRWDGPSFSQGGRGIPALSEQQIRAFVDHAEGVSIIEPRYKLLYRDTLDPVDTGRNGPYGDPGDCSPWFAGGVITHDGDQAVKRSAVFEMWNADELGYNPLQHWIQVFCDWYDTSGDFQFERPVGVFFGVTPDRTLTDDATIDQLQTLDLSGRFSDMPFLNTQTLTRNTPFETAVRTLLQCDRLPRSLQGTGQATSGMDLVGPGIPAGRIHMDPTLLNLPSDQIYGDNTTVMAEANRLLTAINYQTIGVDSVADFNLRQRVNASAQVPAPAWSYAVGDDGVIGPLPQDRLTNAADWYNIVKINCQSTAGAAFSAIAYNQNPTSGISLQNSGWPRLKVISDSTIPDGTTANQRATLEVMAAASASEELTFTVPINPFFEGEETIGVTITDSAGRVKVYSAIGFRLKGWQIDLHNRTQTLTVQRWVAL